MPAVFDPTLATGGVQGPESKVRVRVQSRESRVQVGVESPKSRVRNEEQNPDRWTPSPSVLASGFLVANVRVGLDAIRFLRRRCYAVLTGGAPAALTVCSSPGVALGL